MRLPIAVTQGQAYLTPPALYLFGLSTGLSTAGITIALGLMLVTLLIRPWPFFRFARQSPIFWVATFLTLYILARAYWATLQFPQATEVLKDKADDLLMIAGLPALILAWHLSQAPRRVYPLIGVYILGLLIAFFHHAGWDTFWAYLNGEEHARLRFGGSFNTIGALFATGFLATLSLGIDWLRRLRGRFANGGILCLGGFLILTGIFLVLIVFWNQSRTVWIALALSLFVLALLQFHQTRTPGGEKRTVALTVGTLLLLLPGLGLLQGHEMVWNRIEGLSTNVQDVLTGEVGPQTSEPVEVRFRLLESGWAGIQRRPLWGWGPGNLGAVVEQAGYPTLKRWPHFHNLYIQLAIGLGLVGIGGFAALLGWGLRDLYRAYREGHIEPPLLVFIASTWTFFLVLSLGQIRHDDPQGKAYLILLLGLTFLGGVKRYRDSSKARDPEGPT